MLYCCKTGNILGCRRRIAVWKIPGEILLLLLAQGRSQLQYFAQFGTVPFQEEVEKLGKEILEEQDQARPGKQGVQEYSQEAVGAQSSREKTERVCVCPFSYVTSKVVADRKGIVCSLCPQQVDQREDILTCSKGALDIQENFLIVRRARHWRRLPGNGAGANVISPGSFPGWDKVACVPHDFGLPIQKIEERLGDLTSSFPPCFPCGCDTCSDEAGFVLPCRAKLPAELCSETSIIPAGAVGGITAPGFEQHFNVVIGITCSY